MWLHTRGARAAACKKRNTQVGQGLAQADSAQRASLSTPLSSVGEEDDTGCVVVDLWNASTVASAEDESKTSVYIAATIQSKTDPLRYHNVNCTKAGSSQNTSSRGHLEHIFRYAAKEYFNVEVNGPLEYVVGRNPDFREVSLVVEGKEVQKLAVAYGLRNIQSIMTKIRRNRCPYHYVEIMACPSECLNGGGQIRPKSTVLASELLDNVTSHFQELCSLGVTLVIDSICSGDFALLESRAEFLHRYRNQQKTIWARPPSFVAVLSAKTEFLEPSTTANPLQDPLRAMPVLASSCPGWNMLKSLNRMPFRSLTRRNRRNKLLARSSSAS
ncbi:nuclear prelamin A recognition factor-like protein [Phytophthora infestans T30-4]|uniref:Nuclear prelamin A recognition factor-like protein n=1 Tax=Phytophthora infestans (strain T30-4) TaxID=403677 RepID=D0NI17_PHYIT|nr:nuclear prelamin A recognition factor-like protein [Phytophthora infestans T30-4]EEY59102.1 nuclear prelamin A recognition factor-like protein [Phytophthora infestans T30-4]|eukprot:XP_002901116.1 nuclear prelamin A recognition factor-like protein [Phytophthora infestans T30-4]